MTMLPGFPELYDRADARRDMVPIAVAGGDDPTVLAALRSAVDRGWIRPIVVGPEAEIRALAADFDVNLSGMEIISAGPDEIARSAVAEVRTGRARAVMKGQIATPELMKAVLDSEHGLRTGRTICQVVLMEIPRDNRRFLLADTGITVRPSLEDKADILRSTIETAQRLGVRQPRAALMSATETVKSSMPETLDAVNLARRFSDGPDANCLVQGPLSFDLAYAADAGDRKRVGGSVVGAADIMVFPDLLSANLTVKAIMYTADCRFGGVLSGTSAPVVFMSRADDAVTRLNSIALMTALLDAESNGSKRAPLPVRSLPG